MSRAARLILCALLGLALTACKTDARVNVNVKPNGSGIVRIEVELDKEAVQAAEAGGGKLEDRVRLSDLTKNGWKIVPWDRTSKGSAVLILSKQFASPKGLSSVIQEVSGKTGPLQDFKLKYSSVVVQSKYKLSGNVNLKNANANIADDKELIKKLTAAQVDTAALEKDLDALVKRGLQVSVTADLPGVSGKTVTVNSGQSKSLSVSSSQLDRGNIFKLFLALVFLGLAGLIMLRSRAIKNRKRARELAGEHLETHPSKAGLSE